MHLCTVSGVCIYILLYFNYFGVPVSFCVLCLLAAGSSEDVPGVSVAEDGPGLSVAGVGGVVGGTASASSAAVSLGLLYRVAPAVSL